MPEGIIPELDVYLSPIKEPMIRYAFAIQNQLVREGITCEVDLMDRSLKKSLEQADSKNARLVVIIGERDVEKGEVSIRDMQTKKTEQVKLEKVLQFVENALHS